MPEASPASTTPAGTASGPLMLDLHLDRQSRMAFPYSRVLAIDWQGMDDSHEQETITIRYPECEVRVMGRRLTPLLERLARFEVAEIAKVDPFRVFSTDGAIVEAILVLLEGY